MCGSWCWVMLCEELLMMLFDLLKLVKGVYLVVFDEVVDVILVQWEREMRDVVVVCWCV